LLLTVLLRLLTNFILTVKLLKGNRRNERIATWKKDLPHFEEEEDLLGLRIANLRENTIAGLEQIAEEVAFFGHQEVILLQIAEI
jgi:hypothetical protein